MREAMIRMEELERKRKEEEARRLDLERFVQFCIIHTLIRGLIRL